MEVTAAMAPIARVVSWHGHSAGGGSAFRRFRRWDSCTATSICTLPKRSSTWVSVYASPRLTPHCQLPTASAVTSAEAKPPVAAGAGTIADATMPRPPVSPGLLSRWLGRPSPCIVYKPSLFHLAEPVLATRDMLRITNQYLSVSARTCWGAHMQRPWAAAMQCCVPISLSHRCGTALSVLLLCC